MSTPTKSFLTPEAYLETERKAEYKSEYSNGEMFAMAGVNRRHDAIAVQLQFLLSQHLRRKKCRVNSSSMRILVNPAGLYTYPDLSVVCEEPRYTDSLVDTLVNPALVVEILSPSTEAYDRGKNAKLYRAMPSLVEYLLIAQDSYDVELYRRQADGTWPVIEAGGLDSSIDLTTIGYTLHLRELYEPLLPEGSPLETTAS